MKKIQFASDNNAGICPEALKYLEKVNDGHEPSYREDKWTKLACDLFREIFNCNCEIFFVFTGTAANGLAISTLCQSYHSVICHKTSHIETDECGAPEFFSHGSKLLLAEGENGKINPLEIPRLATMRTDIHYPKPKVVSITQATELGTVYKISELNEISALAKAHNLRIHMDGARFGNALASLKCSPPAISSDIGVDVLCLGGPKNGTALGEAVIFFKPELAEEFAYRCKQSGQLAAKMRFIAAQWLGILENGVWLKYAERANLCAAYLEQEIKKIPEIKIMYPREANSLFLELPNGLADYLRSCGWRFYTFIGSGGARFMCSWDSTEEAITALVNDIKKGLKKNEKK